MDVLRVIFVGMYGHARLWEMVMGVMIAQVIRVVERVVFAQWRRVVEQMLDDCAVEAHS